MALLYGVIVFEEFSWLDLIGWAFWGGGLIFYVPIFVLVSWFAPLAIPWFRNNEKRVRRFS